MTRSVEYGEPITILVIEDNDGDFVLVEDYLLEKFNNIKIERCRDFGESKSYLKGNTSKLSVIFLDLHLHDIGGLELVKKVLSYSYNVPILILTGYADLSLAQLSLQLGVYDFLIKDELNPNLLHKSIDFAINRRQFISQIESERSNFEDLFNFSPQPMWLLDTDGYNILNANLSAIEKYGYSLKDYQKMSYLDLHPKEETKLITRRLSDYNLEEINNNFTHCLKNGEQIKVDFYSKKVKGHSRDMKRIIVQSNDVTEKLNHINTIEIQNKKLKNIAWTQSHEVRAPLSRILGIANIIETLREDPKKLSFWLEQLKNSSQEMDEIIAKTVKETQILNLKDQK